MRLNNNSAFDAADSWPSIGSGHSYDKFLPPTRYYDKDPEWFNLIDGRRCKGRSWQVCFTNREAAKEFARNLCASIRLTRDKQGIPLEHMRLCVSPNDCKARCECENCRKLVDRDGSASSLVTHFANMVADEVRQSFPTARIVFYAYDNYSTPPDHVEPGPGVHPEIVFWTWSGSFAANHAHPMFSDANDKYRRCFRKWAAISDGISAHEYYGHYTWFTPWPKTTQMVNDIRALAERKTFYGMYSESHLHWGTQGLTFYLQPKLMWNPRLDVEKLVDDYCEKAFGPSGPTMRRYFDILQSRMDNLGYVCGYAVEIPQLLTPEIVAECNELMNEAEGLLEKMDPNTRWRSNLVIEAWRASARFAEASRLYVSAAGPDARARIASLTSEVATFAESEQGRWAFEQRIARQAIDSIGRNLQVDLSNLPAGRHRFDDSFNYGGAIKFFAKLSGWQRGMWGYSLRGRGKGYVELPLRCVEGHRLSAAKLKWNFVGQSLDLRLTAIGSNGEEHLLTRLSAQPAEGVAVPQTLLGARELVFRLWVTSKHDSPQIVLTGIRLDATVEKR